MVSSMTGFARSEDTSDGAILIWELRSVNHRYLELAFRLPEEFRSVEAAFRERLSASIRRGKVDAVLRVQNTGANAADLELNKELAATIAAHAKTVAAELNNDKDPDPMSILRWPGVVTEKSPDTESLLPGAEAALEIAVGSLAAARKREGERIAGMIESRLAAVETIVAEVRARQTEVRGAIRERLTKKLEQLLDSPDTERLEQEIVLLAQKSDVDEELDRLDSHAAEVRTVLQSDEPVGRRLDFLMQECNREANTLSSKAADTETTNAAVELKVLIEQMREQVQNVE